MTQAIALRQDRKLISTNKAMNPACAKTINPDRSAKSNSAQMKMPKRRLFMPQASFRVKARMKYTASKSQTGMNIADALSCLASDIKVGVSWLLRQMDKLSTLKKMTPRTGETEGSGFSLLGEVLNRAGVIAPGDTDKVMFISAFVNPLRSHVPLSFAGFTYETRCRGGNSPTFGAPTARVAVMGARDNQDYKCRLGSYSQSPQGQNVGQASDPRYGYPGYTANMTPQIALPSAGRDSGAGSMTKGTDHG